MAGGSVRNANEARRATFGAGNARIVLQKSWPCQPCSFVFHPGQWGLCITDLSIRRTALRIFASSRRSALHRPCENWVLAYVAPAFRRAYACIYNVGLKADATKASPRRVLTQTLQPGRREVSFNRLWLLKLCLVAASPYCDRPLVDSQLGKRRVEKLPWTGTSMDSLFRLKGDR